MKNKAVALLLTFLTLIFFFSCSSVKIKDRIEVNADDWLQRGGNPQNTNQNLFASIPSQNIRQLWTFNADAGFPKTAMIATDAILFTSTLRGDMYAVDITTGKNLGKFGKIGGAPNCPAYSSSEIILTFDGDPESSVLSYNLKTGNENWRRNLGMIRTSPVIDSGFVYVTSTDSVAYKLSLTTGELVWLFENNKDSLGLKPYFSSPVVNGSNVIVCNVNGFIYCLNKETGKINWSYKTNAPVYSDPSIYNNKLFVCSDDKNIYCMNLDGSLNWKKDLNTTFISSCSFYGNNVIVSGVDGIIHSLDITSGNENWQFKTEGTINGAPLVVNDKILVSSLDRNFYILNTSDGSRFWEMSFESRLKASPLVWKNFLFIACENKEIYCFKYE
jgi:outer membrane protein assembly factor BamB